MGGRMLEASKGAAHMTTLNYGHAAARLDIGRCFTEAFEVYRRNLLVLIVAALLFYLICAGSLLILAGPMTGGVCILSLRALASQDKRVQLGDLFGGFQRFGALVGLF